jgi:hypothetical protein
MSGVSVQGRGKESTTHASGDVARDFGARNTALRNARGGILEEAKTLWLAGLAQRPTSTPETRQAVSSAAVGLEHWKPSFFHEGQGRGSVIVTRMVHCMARACIDYMYYFMAYSGRALVAEGQQGWHAGTG